MKVGLITSIRPEANVIYTWAGRSRSSDWCRSATDASIFCSGDLRVGVKVQSNLAISGPPRSIFRIASLETDGRVEH